ncbi:hypothetical protein NDU88_001091 [Pleurodeles waltl]|uniref:Reverse transcriptase domain-containing protein n=1 Tax=Pleurodeles waltl TaxID=8319 RepID=A0AAV7R7K4_PLEWA|nr:hypothetical protein NDU88_001091 [Pleurodeles waltl]
MLRLDIEALYTSIPQEESLQAITDLLLSQVRESAAPAKWIMLLAKLALTENFFSFEDQIYLQHHGASMGSTFAPSIACLYVRWFEEGNICANNTFNDDIRLWRRYIDDILVIWHGDETTIELFITWLKERSAPKIRSWGTYLLEAGRKDAVGSQRASDGRSGAALF